MWPPLFLQPCGSYGKREVTDVSMIKLQTWRLWKTDWNSVASWVSILSQFHSTLFDMIVCNQREVTRGRWPLRNWGHKDGVLCLVFLWALRFQLPPQFPWLFEASVCVFFVFFRFQPSSLSLEFPCAIKLLLVNINIQREYRITKLKHWRFLF